MKLEADRRNKRKMIIKFQVPSGRSKKRKTTRITSIHNNTGIYRPLKRVCYRLKGLQIEGRIQEATLISGGNTVVDELIITFTPYGMESNTPDVVLKVLRQHLD